MSDKPYDQFLEELIEKTKRDVKDWKNSYSLNISVLYGVIFGILINLLTTALYQEIIIKWGQYRYLVYLILILLTFFVLYLILLEVGSYKTSIEDRETFIERLKQEKEKYLKGQRKN